MRTTTHHAAIGLALNPSAPDAGDLTRYVEEVEQDGIAGIEQDIGEDENAAALVKVLADASRSGLIQLIANGRALDPDRDLQARQAFEALASAADRLSARRQELVMEEAESRLEDRIEQARAA